jgi:hypothetical protein
MTSSSEERAAYIHEARVAVRTAKDREVEAKLEKVQKDFADEMRLFEEEVPVPVAGGEATDFVEGNLEGDAGLTGVGGGLDAGDAHPGGGANGRRGPLRLLPRVCHKVV